MIVGNVTGVTVHLNGGKTIYFGEDEISLQVVRTLAYDPLDDKSVGSLVEYYIITTTPLEG